MLFAPFLYVSQMVQIINFRGFCLRFSVFYKRSTADAVNYPFVPGTVRCHYFKFHSGRMKRECNFRMPNNFGSFIAEYLKNGNIRKVAFACCC